MNNCRFILIGIKGFGKKDVNGSNLFPSPPAIISIELFLSFYLVNKNQKSKIFFGLFLLSELAKEEF